LGSRLKLSLGLILVLIVTVSLASCNIFDGLSNDYEISFYDLTFLVEDEHKDPVSEAIVKLNGEEKTTNDQGKAVFEDVEEGHYDYQVSQDCYEIIEGGVEVEGETREEVVLEYSDDICFNVSNLNIEPEKAFPGEEVTVTANIENRGYEEGERDVDLYVYPEGSEPIAPFDKIEDFKLDSGEEDEVEFVEELEEDQDPGIYIVKIKSADDSAEDKAEVLSTINVNDPEVIASEEGKLEFRLDIAGIDLECEKGEFDITVECFEGLIDLHGKDTFAHEDFIIAEIEDEGGQAELKLHQYGDGVYSIDIDGKINAGGYLLIELDPHDKDDRWQESGAVTLEAKRPDNENTDEFEVIIEID